MPTVAETLAQTLYDAGVRFAFGMPGGETVEILDAMRRRDIRFELVHHETSAVFMADAVARVSGTPAVALTTLGPGAMNAVPGIAHAHLDRSPVVLITAQKPDALLPDYTHQVLDLHAIFAPITKQTVKITAANVNHAVAAAIALAQEDRPGPVHLQISNEEAGLTADDRPQTAAARSNLQSPISNITALQTARALLASARRPVIVVGVGMEPEAAYASLREFAEATGAPIIVTPKAKGALPDDHALSAGTVGLTRTDPVYEILDEADCVVAVGFDVVELVKEWQHPAPLIWLAPWPNVDPVLPAAVELVGPLSPLLQQLSDGEFASAPDWGAARVAQFHAKVGGTSIAHTCRWATFATNSIVGHASARRPRNFAGCGCRLAQDLQFAGLADAAPQPLSRLQRAFVYGLCSAQRAGGKPGAGRRAHALPDWRWRHGNVPGGTGRGGPA